MAKAATAVKPSTQPTSSARPTAVKTVPAVAAVPAQPAPAKPAEQALYILDTTATAIEPKRTHEMLIDGLAKSFTFESGKPLKLPPAIALKFLKHWPAFQRSDEDGDVLPYRPAPKQPDELQAGEQIVVADDQTIANLDELSNTALQNRVLMLHGGEQFAEKPSRAAMLAFMIEHRKKTKVVNLSKQPDIGQDEFVPPAEVDDAA